LSRALSIALSLVVLLTVVAPVAAKNPMPDPGMTVATLPEAGEIIAGEVVVGFNDLDRGSASIRSRGLELRRVMDGPSRATALIGTAGRPLDQVMAELRADPAVAFAEPNYVVRLADEGTTAVAVDDPMNANQYSLDQMRVRAAWSASTGGSNVIAVLDTGVQFNHPDLAGRLLSGYDFVNDDSNAGDDNGHGTWVAGIIAANANDGYGMAGITWSDKVLPVKIMSREGTGSTADLAAGIIYAADKGADVINMSVGGFPYLTSIQNAVNYAWNKGAVLVGAAGNNRREEVFYPASYDNVVSVSATQVNDEFSNWSSWGPKVDVSAPGSSVLVTNCYTCTYGGHDTWGSHTYISGTSFAAPNVSGVVALIRARYPSYTPQQVVDRLRNTSDDKGYAGWDSKYGRGRVNAARALGSGTVGGWPSSGDSIEPNNSLASAVRIPVGTTTSPTLHPAGDVDFFAVDVGRAGRLDVRVSGIVDTRAYPWNKSSLPLDPIVALYDASGAHIKTVDNEWESGIELAQVQVGGPTRIYVRVTNWYANGNKKAYTVTPTYVDNVAPTAALASPVTGSTGVSRFVDPVLRFSEAVSNVTSSHVALRDLTTNTVVPISVSYNADAFTAQLRPSPTRLEPNHTYRLEIGTGVVDRGGNSVTPATRTFTTGTASFTDTAGTSFEADIEWLFASGISGGCTSQRFCPTSPVPRDQMAAFLSRGLGLAPAGTDWFRDDEESLHEAHINRIAEAGVTMGCAPGRFCPTGSVSRGQMATFLARALGLPAALTDHFDDDDGTRHEDDINRLADAGIVAGCAERRYCPTAAVTREQMAAYLHRSLGD
jgi:type VII secretion-associated serine protease mycosin